MELEKFSYGKKIEGGCEQECGESADTDDEPPAALKDAQGSLAVACGGEHGHLVCGDGAEADIGEAEVGGDGVDDHPLAVEGDAPEMEEDGDLDELDDGGGELADPVGQEAEGESPFCGTFHA